MKNLKTFEGFINEGKSNKKITFPSKTPTSHRISFDVDKIEGEKVYLKNDHETLELTFDGKIKKHKRNDHEMIQTYDVDDTTQKQLDKIK
jgi:hypothetical protein